MGSFFLPCFIMVFVYLRIFKVIHDREKYLRINASHGTTFSLPTDRTKHDQKKCSSFTKCCRKQKSPTRNQLVPNDRISRTITTTESHVHNEPLLRANKREFKTKFKKANDEENKNNSNNIPLRKIVCEPKEEFSCNALSGSNHDYNMKFIDCDNEDSNGANKKHAKETNKQVDIECQDERNLQEQGENLRFDNDSHFINSLDCIDKEKNALKTNSSSSTSSNPFEKKVKEYDYPQSKRQSYEKRETLTELNFSSKFKQTRPPKSISVDNSLSKKGTRENLRHKFYIGSFKTGSFSKFTLEQKCKKSFKTKRASPNNLVARKLASSQSSSNLVLNKLVSTKHFDSSKSTLGHIDENESKTNDNKKIKINDDDHDEEEKQRQDQEYTRGEQDAYEKNNNPECNDKLEKLNSINKKKHNAKNSINKPSISSFGSNSIVLTINRKGNHSTNSEQMRLIKESKAAKTLAIVVGGFVMSWLPFFIMYVLEAVLPHGTITKALSDWITWLGYFNSAVNPVIYAFYSKQFRSAFLRLTFGKCQHNKPNYYNSKNFYWNQTHMTNARSNTIYNTNNTVQRNLVKSVR
jgi:hypothetical protein